MFSNKKQDTSLALLGQPLLIVYVPSKCNFYIRVKNKASSML